MKETTLTGESKDILKNEQRKRRLEHTSDMILKAIHDLDERFKNDPEVMRRCLESSRSPELKSKVAQYINNKINGGDKIASLVKALSNYGASARLYFNYETEGAVISADLSSVTADTLSPYKYSKIGNNIDGIESIGANLTLESETILNVVGNVPPVVEQVVEEDNSVVIEETKVETLIESPKQEEMVSQPEQNQVEVSNIPAQYLDVMHAFVVMNGAGETTILNYGALSYAYNKITNSNSVESIINLSKCLYL